MPNHLFIRRDEDFSKSVPSEEEKTFAEKSFLPLVSFVSNLLCNFMFDSLRKEKYEKKRENHLR